MITHVVKARWTFGGAVLALLTPLVLHRYVSGDGGYLHPGFFQFPLNVAGGAWGATLMLLSVGSFRQAAGRGVPVLLQVGQWVAAIMGILALILAALVYVPDFTGRS